MAGSVAWSGSGDLVAKSEYAGRGAFVQPSLHPRCVRSDDPERSGEVLRPAAGSVDCRLRPSFDHSCGAGGRGEAGINGSTATLIPSSLTTALIAAITMSSWGGLRCSLVCAGGVGGETMCNRLNSSSRPLPLESLKASDSMCRFPCVLAGMTQNEAGRLLHCESQSGTATGVAVLPLTTLTCVLPVTDSRSTLW
jgi:hypothetical protein